MLNSIECCSEVKHKHRGEASVRGLTETVYVLTEVQYQIFILRKCTSQIKCINVYILVTLKIIQ